jgi:hypothetical protein
MMAYRGIPRGTSKFSPFFLLHGREMVQPTSQDLKAKLTLEVRETDFAYRLENLISTLQSDYKIVRKTTASYMTPTNGITTENQRNEAFNQVKLFISTTLLENPVRVQNFLLLGKDLTRSQHAYQS